MNCNSNTAPLIDTTIEGCNNGCIPKDINIVCRTIIIPEGQNILGVQGEINSNKRIFLVPKSTDNGDDLSGKNFAVVVKDALNETHNIEIQGDETLENYIKLEWIIGEDILKSSGKIYVQIVASSENFVWKTYPAEFLVKESL